ncbi:MAG: sodium:proton antiporter [Ktedonobacterales bacterium]
MGSTALAKSLASVSSGTPAQVAVFAALLAVALVVALVARRLRFPYTLALVVVGLLLGVSHLTLNLRLEPDVVLFIFLPTLLFEGAWALDVWRLMANRLLILLLAVPGLIISLFVVGAVLHLGAGFPWLVALLVGAIVSPTDPVSIVSLLRQLGMSARLRTIIEGESLFNDGVGAVAYTIVLSLLLTLQAPNAQMSVGSLLPILLHGVWLFVGGPLLGIGVGYLVSRFLSRFEDRLIEILTTLVVAYGVYLIGDLIQTSGLLAVVCAGLVLGSYGRRHGMSEQALEAVDNVWEFLAFVANSLLFLLLGLQIGASSLLSAAGPILWATLGIIVGRALLIPLLILPYNALAHRRAQRMRQRHQDVPHRPHIQRQPAGDGVITTYVRYVRTLGWPAALPRIWQPLLLLAGLRGALSLALALSLPAQVPHVSLLEQVVYGVTLITLLGQGVALRAALPHWPKLPEPSPAAEKPQDGGGHLT